MSKLNPTPQAKGEKPVSEKTGRKKYAQPLLIVFGDIVELTRGGNIGNPEGTFGASGAGTGPIQKP